VQLTPDSAKARHLFGLTLIQTDRLEEAVVQFEKSLQLDPQSDEDRKILADVRAVLQSEGKAP